MRILVVMDPIERILVSKDTTFGFMLAAQARGHELFYCNLEHLYVEAGRTWARAAPVEVRNVAGDHYTLGAWVDVPLHELHSVWMRKDPPVDHAYLNATFLLDHAGTLVVNEPRGLRAANEKLYTLHFPEVIPETLVTRDPNRIRRWLEKRGAPLIVKPVHGHGGLGVFYLDAGDRNVPSILETLTEEGRRWIVAQEYLPAAREGDKRIIVLDGEPLGAILRVPRADDHRGNIHQGGSTIASPLTDRDREICAALKPRLKADGLYFVGLDVIGGRLTEVNVTSPTGIRELLALAGVDAGDAYVRWIEDRI
jgi:glutathione synthase